MDDETSAIEGAMTTALRRVGLYKHMILTSLKWLIQYHEEEQMYNEASSMTSSGQVSKKKKKKMSAATGGGGVSTASSNITTPQLCYHGDMEWLCYNMVIYYI